MKKILLSISMIAFVGAVVVGATGAFFTDTETSTGNTFTAGAIDLKVDNQQHYDGMVCQNVGTEEEPDYRWVEEEQGSSTYPELLDTECNGTWTETDLGAETFFYFTDVKPGDFGENTISLHVINNDAYACVDVDITKNDDVSSTEPELGDGDAEEEALDDFDGELAQNLNFFAWADDGDNIFQQGELPLFSNVYGPASDVLGGKTYTLADPNIGVLPAGDTRYVGLAWCLGAMSVDVQNAIVTCDGSTLDNKTQTDSVEASIAFRVVQSRNNDLFTCERPEVPQAPVEESKGE